MKETFKFTITYESLVDTDTGEILETKIVSKSDLKETKTTKSSSKKVEDTDTTPKLILEDNKFCLNLAAVALMQLTPDDKIDIKYENGGIPVIGTDTVFGTKGGNKLTKSNTVACRGGKHDELAKFGNEFVLIKHPDREGLFVLTSDKVKSEQLNGDGNVQLDPEDEVDFDLDLADLVDDKDANETEIDQSFFQL